MKETHTTEKKKNEKKKEERENLKRDINNGLDLFSCQIHRANIDEQVEINKEKHVIIS